MRIVFLPRVFASFHGPCDWQFLPYCKGRGRGQARSQASISPRFHNVASVRNFAQTHAPFVFFPLFFPVSFAFVSSCTLAAATRNGALEQLHQVSEFLACLASAALFRPGSRLMPCVLRYVTSIFRVGNREPNLKHKLKTNRAGTSWRQFLIFVVARRGRVQLWKSPVSQDWTGFRGEPYSAGRIALNTWAGGIRT